MKRGVVSLDRLDALIARTERKIVEQVIRSKTAGRDTRAAESATRRLANLNSDPSAYRRARDAVAEARRLR